MDRDYSYSYEFDERYCYPHSDVLMNKLGIRDAEELKKAEREITSVRLANARVHKIKGNFDLQHLMDMVLIIPWNFQKILIVQSWQKMKATKNSFAGMNN